MFFNKIALIFFSLLCFPYFLSAQSKNANEPASTLQQKIQDITEENLQFYLTKKQFVVLYFYSSHNPESLKMKEILPQALIDNKPAIYSIQIDTNLGLRQTFNVSDLPAIVVLKNRKLLYGLSGYIDDASALSDFINQGIKFSDAP